MAKIFKLLKDDHDKHRELLEQISQTEGDSPDRRSLYTQFKEEVTAHANAEEQSLYAEMLARPELQEDGRHSVAEHKELDDLMAELDDIEMSSPGWLQKFKVLRHEYEHHIEEEEEDMFPVAEDEFVTKCEERLGDIYADRLEAELESAQEGISHDTRD
ncbi:hemerythrin domain-containing protein [Parasphingorhabdus cellanae]|uniref:Hemerythrin domain-containing protein n=1 Tax=Parasphingorhabdus cellanae TaxID=2806553 RepID=A0ABX7T6S6_9SPHN|nr:hemerythrin domain-containing protein [Parasphingorhabdus cellanae]QTD57226.1 hemerythrin domain-containing protein [Parasphingorhabdus cellanae]